MDAALRSRGDRIEAEQRARRNDDLSAMRLGEIEQVRACKQRTAAEHHDLLAGFEHRPAYVLDGRRGRAFDCEIGMLWKIIESHQRAPNAFTVEPGLRLGAVADGGASQREPGQPVPQVARQHASDGTQSGNGDARHFSSNGAYPSYGAVFGAARRSEERRVG